MTVKMQNMQFEGQTKTKLGNPEVKNIVENLLTDGIKDYLNKAKKDVIDAIYEKARVAAKARESAAKAKSVARYIKVSSRYEFPHISKEHRHQYRSDMRAVLVGVGKNYDFVIFEVIAPAAAQNKEETEPRKLFCR